MLEYCYILAHYIEGAVYVYNNNFDNGGFNYYPNYKFKDTNPLKLLYSHTNGRFGHFDLVMDIEEYEDM